MSIDLNNTNPVDQTELRVEPLLAELQVNIHKGHGRDHTANIFVGFDPTKVTHVCAWLHECAAAHVTSAKQQLRENEGFKRHGMHGALFAGLYLTARGYEYFAVESAKRPADTSFAAA